MRPEPRGDPVAELLGRLAREGQRQHLRRVGAAALDAVDDRLDQRRGLAGAGAGEHEQRPALVVDDALLVVVEDRRPARARRGAPGGTSWSPSSWSDSTTATAAAAQ